MEKKRLSTPKPVTSFPKLEERILRLWKREKTFEASLKQTAKGKRFTFYDGPPFATGLPHYGHLLQGTIKDIVPRFRTMQGRYVERRFGWDCHGLPVEYELEKERGIKGRPDILKMGVATFNDACRSIVLRHTKEWQKTTERLGRWIDFENDYKTMDPEYMESIWWVVKTLWEKGLLYEGRKAMHICPRCATPLSNFEVTLGYRDRVDESVSVAFPLADEPDTALVAWTTTPWTLPGNVLLAVGPRIRYVKVRHDGRQYVVAADRVTAVFGDDAEVLGSVKAGSLVGRRYEPPFPVVGLSGKHYEVVASGAVTAEDGTGVLHVAPAFGEEDNTIGEREGAAFIRHVDITGRFTEQFGRHVGMKAHGEGDAAVITDLAAGGRLVRKERFTHSYPHCWRCDTPLLNYTTDSWFVAVTKLKRQLLAENRKIDWTPDHVRDGRFGKWLEGARDWAISRNRFWGNPLPVWKCGNGHVTVIGSREELKRLSGKAPRDLHKQFVDDIAFPCPDCGEEARRIEDVLDCWFESGSMPYASVHYPFEHRREFAQRYPADFIAEALDQTRGWFYTLHVLGVALQGSRAFEQVVTTGLVLAEDGKKMSKRLKNYPEPSEVFSKYGADAMRLYLVQSPVVRGDDLRFVERDVAELSQSFLGTLYNTYVFLATYASVDGWEVSGRPRAPKHLMDRWILARMDGAVRTVTSGLEQGDLMAASRELSAVLDDLSNWYVRRSRRRFWKSESDVDKRRAYATLHHVLCVFTRLAAPFVPFLTDHIHRELTGKSAHLAAWPRARKVTAASARLAHTMADAREIVRLGLAARGDAGVKVRQPLALARVIDRSGRKKSNEIVQIIAEELNVKKVRFVEREGKLVRKVPRPVPAVLGPALGSEVQRVIRALKQGEYQVRGRTVIAAGHRLPPDGVEFVYEHGGELAVCSSEHFVVALDTELSDALKQEGYARDVIRHVQELRKSRGLSVDDRIELTLATDTPELMRALGTHRRLIEDETLARPLALEETGPEAERVYVSGLPLTISLRRA